jgi:DNA (cytosine-5)-methyltransferase 1
MTYGSLFSGIGGFDLGFDRAGMKCVWQVERDKDCQRILNKHWSGIQTYDDVTKFDPVRAGPTDVICGGFPCQDLSLAGKRAGLVGKRSGLWHEFHRIIAVAKPRFVVVENVPGLFSSNRGRDFLVILRGLAKLRYCSAWTMLNSQFFGLAQRRERVFIVGSLGNGSCAEILFEPESLRRDNPPRRKTREEITARIGNGVASGIPEIAGTLGSNEDGGQRTTDLDGTGAFIPTVAKALNAERDGYNDGSDQTYIPTVAGVMQSGQANAVISDDDKIGALNCDHEQPIIVFSCKDSGADATDELSPTLRSMGHDESHSNGGGQLAVAFQTRIARNGRGQPDEIAPALSGADAGATSDMRPCVAATSGVRRLTPRECERLQGFPDDWTRFDAAGKELSDSPRYRMLGNAVSVPVAEWIGCQIVRVASN